MHVTAILVQPNITHLDIKMLNQVPITLPFHMFQSLGCLWKDFRVKKQENMKIITIVNPNIKGYHPGNLLKK